MGVAAMVDALAVADRGDVAAAAAMLRDATQTILRSPSARDPAVQELLGDMSRCIRSLTDVDTYHKVGRKRLVAASECHAAQRSIGGASYSSPQKQHRIRALATP